MTDTTPEMQPDTQEVLQVEPGPLTTVPVSVCEILAPVRTQALPRRDATSSTKAVTTAPLQVLWADPFRACAQITSFTGDMLVSFNSASASSPYTSAQWPVGKPLTVTATCDVWVAAATGSISVSVITERWATGDA